MSNNNADEIRDDIERTRAELGDNVDALADKVRPSSIAHRQAGRIRGAFSTARERVMGTASDVAEAGGSAMSSAAGAVGSVPQTIARKTEGHPVAVGIIAFGAGLLLSSLVPSTTRERELAQVAKEKAAPLAGELGDAAREAAENLREPAKEAVDAVKGTAEEAVENVRAEGSDAAAEVKDSATGARDRVQGSGPDLG